jgi:recombination protein RecA
MSFSAKPVAKPTVKATSLTSMSDDPLTKMRKYLIDKKGKDYTSIRVVLDDNSLKESLPHIPSGSDVVDFIIGGEPNSFGVAPCPGFPRGRVAQIWGHESAGKTTLCLEAVAAVCKAGGTAVYIDWENDIVPDYAAALGVPITDPKRFELLQPETLEDGIKYAMAYAAAGVDLIVFDSVGSAVPRRLADRDALDVAEQGKIAELQSVWSQELPNLKNVIAKSGTAVIGISQVRATMNSMGAQTKPQGGNAWKFFSSVRLELRRMQNEKSKEHNVLNHKSEERVVGGIIKVTAIKNKLSKSQGREEIFYIRWGEGVDNVRTMIEIASAHGIVKKSGSWLTWEDCPSGPVKVLGTEKFRAHFVEHTSDYEALRARVLPLLGAGKSVEGLVEEKEDFDPLSNLGISIEDDGPETQDDNADSLDI